MKEQFLQLVWKLKLFEHSNLRLFDGTTLIIKDYGIYNSNESGPDFLNARVIIDDIVWSGNIEIHLKSSDWYKHNHHRDAAYNNVVLHVVWENDCSVEINGWKVPVLELKDRVQQNVLHNFSKFQRSISNFPCQRLISNIDPIFLRQMIDSSLFLRLERKTALLIDMELNQLAYTLFSKAIGGKVNQFAFEYLAEHLPFSFVEQLNIKQRKLTIASHRGLDLSNQTELSKVFVNYKRKGMRPASFPEKRLMQFANIIPIVSKLNELIYLSPEELIFQFRKYIQQFDDSITFGTQNLLLINAIVPYLFIRSKLEGFDQLQEKALDILSILPPEKNNIVSKMKELGFAANNSFDSQALLEIYNEFCLAKKCLNCAIGMKIINS
jgi:hypothetical protein